MQSVMIKEILIILSILVFSAQGKSSRKPGDLIEFDAPTIISRSEWGAKKPKEQADPLHKNPASYVIVHHSSTDTCVTRAICQAKVRLFQDHHMKEKNFSDIGYNFLVGEDGNVYEGRGWGKSGAHTKGYNDKSIGICIIGNYNNRVPNNAATEAIKNLIYYGISLGKIDKNYSLIGHRQALSSTTCPGNKLYELIKTWPHWTKSP